MGKGLEYFEGDGEFNVGQEEVLRVLNNNVGDVHEGHEAIFSILI